MKWHYVLKIEKLTHNATSWLCRRPKREARKRPGRNRILPGRYACYGAMVLVVLAVLLNPPVTTVLMPLARLLSPPVTVAFSPLALFAVPEVTTAKIPVALLFDPPMTEASGPEMVFPSPPTMPPKDECFGQVVADDQIPEAVDEGVAIEGAILWIIGVAVGRPEPIDDMQVHAGEEHLGIRADAVRYRDRRGFGLQCLNGGRLAVDRVLQVVIVACWVLTVLCRLFTAFCRAWTWARSWLRLTPGLTGTIARAGVRAKTVRARLTLATTRT
ncbi:MAG TPA: hypothetical protein VFW40_03310 [Capsulimonadaceae bacterium]|nr:hypothetical protein [Capsulimonadaceae bacterium]